MSAQEQCPEAAGKKYANINEINYTSGCKLNKYLISQLSTCVLIREGRKIFITGVTRSGKTYMAYAFSYEVCRQYYTTRFVSLPDLLIELEMTRENRTFAKAILMNTKPALLITPKERKNVDNFQFPVSIL